MEVKSNILTDCKFVCHSEKVLRLTERPWTVNGVVAHSYKPPATTLAPYFYPCISITSASWTTLPGGISEGRFANKAANKANLWTALGLQLFHYFPWLTLCFPAVDWSMYGSVSDWWSFTLRHKSSAAPSLCLETVKNEGKRQQHCCANWWVGFLTLARSLNSLSDFSIHPAEYSLSSLIWFSWCFTTFYLSRARQE